MYQIERNRIEHTEHQAVIKGMCNKGFIINSSILPRLNFGVGGQVRSPESLTAYSLSRSNKRSD